MRCLAASLHMTRSGPHLSGGTIAGQVSQQQVQQGPHSFSQGDAASMLTAAPLTAQVGEQKECRCGHKPPCQFYQKDWGPVNPLVLKPHVPVPRAKKAAMTVDDLDDLDPERAPEFVDAQIEADMAAEEAEVSEEAKDEGAMDEGSDEGVDSNEA